LIKTINTTLKGVLMQLAKTVLGGRVLMVSMALTLFVGTVYGVGAFSDPAMQDVRTLDRRISLVEQRFYAMEARMNRLEQQAAASTRPPSAATTQRDGEISLLTNEIDQLRRRLAEVECGVVRVDERTRPSARDKAATDPCRINSDEPVRLSARP
jgi:hypothetical protein